MCITVFCLFVHKIKYRDTYCVSWKCLRESSYDIFVVPLNLSFKPHLTSANQNKNPAGTFKIKIQPFSQHTNPSTLAALETTGSRPREQNNSRCHYGEITSTNTDCEKWHLGFILGRTLMCVTV